MDYFQYDKKQLHAENIPITDITNQYGTPCYIYSRATLVRHWQVFDQALGNYPHQICYAVKANSNLAVLNVLAQLGSGFDIVSGGELARVIAAQGNPSKTVFSGIGKRSDEIQAALEAGIGCLNVESEPELERINQIAAQLGKKAPIAIRINPNVDAKTHPYIATGLKDNKFGIDINSALAAYQKAQTLPHLEIIGVDCHIGSQITELSPFLAALDSLLSFIQTLKDHDISITHLNLGGGLGVPYKTGDQISKDEIPPSPAEYANAIFNRLQQSEIKPKLMIEPGRVIAANAGILVTRVEYLKTTPHKNFAIVDAAMNDLIRPSLYQAWQTIIPVIEKDDHQNPQQTYDIVGPVCESGDFLGKERALNLAPNDLLAVRTAGAYGFVMSSNYNTRPRCPEVMVDSDQVHLVRERESVADLLKTERLIHDA